MSAPNFYVLMARNYYVFTPHYLYDYELVRFDIVDTAEHLYGYTKLNEQYASDFLKEMAGNNSSYYSDALPLCDERVVHDSEDGDWKIELVPILRGGYYTDYNLDFNMKISTPMGEILFGRDCLNKDLLNDCIDEESDFILDDTGERLNVPMLQEELDETIKEMIDKFTKFAESVCEEEYICSGVFSNGEAVYISKTKLTNKMKGE